MNFSNDINWFAIQTKPHCEPLTEARLRKLDLEVFAPRVRVEQQICGAWRWVTKPLFPGYLFAQFCPAVSLDAVRFSSGVLRVLGGTIATAIPAEAINDLRDSVGECGTIEPYPTEFSPGARVTIEAGPFMGWAGRVLRESDDRKRVTVLLDLLEHARVVTERRCLQLAQS